MSKCKQEYPIEIIHCVPEEDGEGYYIAFLPDLGLATCSGIGKTIGEALRKMIQVRDFTLERWRIEGRPVPEPSVLCPDCYTGRQPKCACSVKAEIGSCSPGSSCRTQDTRPAHPKDEEDDTDTVLQRMHDGIEGVRISRKAKFPAGPEAIVDVLDPKEAEALRQAKEAWARRREMIAAAAEADNPPSVRDCAPLLVQDLALRHEQLEAHLLSQVSESLGIAPGKVAEALFDAVFPWLLSVVNKAKGASEERN